MTKILLTGGSGRLGTELQKYIQVLAPTIDELNITVRENIYEYCIKNSPSLIIHAAAYTDVAKAQIEKQKCWDINVKGTRFICDIAETIGIPVLFISTDYVFDGEKGMYRENDIPNPVPGNFYALTKFASELIVLQNDRNKVIRTSFKPSKWDYEYAFNDVYTSADYVDIIAKDIASAIINFNKIPNLIHIATDRKTIYELAKQRNPEVKPNSRNDVKVNIPKDVSLDISIWKILRGD